MNLTPLSFGIIALLCMMGVVHQWSPPEAVPWWRVACFVMLLGLLYEWLRVRSLPFRAALKAGTGKLRLGREETLSLELHNASARPVRLVLANALPFSMHADRGTQALDVPKQSLVEHQVNLRATQLGEHAWPKLPMQVRGALGLSWWSLQQPLDETLTVVPDLLGGRAAVPGQTAQGASQAKIGSGYELHQLREYVPGDARDQVDWKATARTQKLMTRLRTQDQHLDVVVVIDAGRTSRTQIDGLSQLGHYVNLTARFAEHALAFEDQVGLVVASDQPAAAIAPARGVRTLRNIRSTLAQLEAQPVESDLLSAALRVRQLVSHRSLIIVLTDLYGLTTRSTLAQSVAAWTPKHLPLVVGLVGSDLDAVARQTAADSDDVYQSLAASEYQRSLALGAQSVRRLGAHTILCRPAELERNLFAQYALLKAQRRI